MENHCRTLQVDGRCLKLGGPPYGENGGGSARNEGRDDLCPWQKSSYLPSSLLPSILPSSLDEARLYSADATVYIFLCALCFFFCAAVIKLEPFFSFFCRNPSGPEILQLLSVTGYLSE